MFYAAGKQPYSIKVGDTWFAWKRIEPINAPLLQITGLMDAFDARDASWTQKAEMFVGHIARSTSSVPMMQGLSNFMNMTTQPERYAHNWFERMIPSVVLPYSAALRTGAQIVDPVVRDATGVRQQFMAGIPFLSKRVPPRVGAAGEYATRTDYPWLPIDVSREQPNWIFDTLNELDINIGGVGNSIYNVPLTRTQHVEYQRTVGKAAMADLEVLIASPRFRNSSREDKITRIEDVIREAKLMVRKRFAATGQFKPSSIERQRTEDWTETPGTSGVGAQRFGR